MQIHICHCEIALTGLQMAAKKKDILRFCIYEMERMMEAMENQTKKVKHVLICNIDERGYSQSRIAS